MAFQTRTVVYSHSRSKLYKFSTLVLARRKLSFLATSAGKDLLLGMVSPALMATSNRYVVIKELRNRLDYHRAEATGEVLLKTTEDQLLIYLLRDDDDDDDVSLNARKCSSIYHGKMWTADAYQQLPMLYLDASSLHMDMLMLLILKKRNYRS